MAGHHKWSEIKHKSGGGPPLHKATENAVQKWRVTFEIEYYDCLLNKWYAGGTTTRVIQKEDYDRAVIYANAMTGEESRGFPTSRLGRLMFIEVAPDNADLEENCACLEASQERAERIFNERSGQYVIDAWKRFEALGF